MKTVGPVRFATFVILSIVGVAFLLAKDHDSGVMLVTIASLLLVTRSDWRATYSEKSTLIILLPLILFPMLMIWVEPKKIETIATDPVLIVPLWTAVLLITFRNWRKQRSA